MMREPIEMLVQVLANGGRVDEGGNEYAMAEDGSLCVVMHDDAGNERPMKVDCDLAGLKRMADDIGRDELLMRCCAMQLREISST
jgi:hypothetical protein